MKKSPYSLPHGSCVSKKMPKNLLKVIKNYQKKLQKDADIKYGKRGKKSKYKVTETYAMKVLGDLLK